MSKAAETRRNILNEAFLLIYRKGFQATSIDEVIARTSVTKGAFFYHFKNKDEMGLAIINEIMYPGLSPYMNKVLHQQGHIRNKLYDMMQGLLLEDPFFNIEYGCPAVNIIEEMAPVNAEFKKALMKIIKQWRMAITNAVKAAQVNKEISKAHIPEDIATFIISNYSGVRITGKVLGKNAYLAFLNQYKTYLAQLS